MDGTANQNERDENAWGERGRVEEEDDAEWQARLDDLQNNQQAFEELIRPAKTPQAKTRPRRTNQTTRNYPNRGNTLASITPFSMPDNHTSDEPVLLDADQTESSLRAIASAFDALAFLRENIKNNTLTKSLRYNCMGSANTYLSVLGERLGTDEDKAQDAALRKSQLRIANDEIQRLRTVMALGPTNDEAVGARLDKLAREVYDWWKSLGFLHAKGHFTGHSREYWYEATLSCYIDAHASSHAIETKPVTARAEKEKQIATLFANADVDNARGDRHYLDTPRNRELIVSQLAKRFPGSRLSDVHVYCGLGKPHMREVAAMIPIQSILPLPTATTDTKEPQPNQKGETA